MTLLLVEGPDVTNARNIRSVLNEGLKHRYNKDLDEFPPSFTFVTDGASVMANVAGSSVSHRLASESQNWMPCMAHQFDTAMKTTMSRISQDGSGECFQTSTAIFRSSRKLLHTLSNRAGPPDYRRDTVEFRKVQLGSRRGCKLWRASLNLLAKFGKYPLL